MESLKKLVVVEDEEALRRGLCHAMPWTDLGFEVAYEAENADEALEFLRYQPIDAVLTDIRMPGMSGLELAQRIAKLDNRIKVVILSGYDDFSYAQTAIQAGVFDYLLKPVKKDKLIEVFQRVARDIQAHRSREARRHRYEAMAEEYVLLRIVSEEYMNAEEIEELTSRIGFYPEGAYRVAVLPGMAGRAPEVRERLTGRLGRTLVTFCEQHAVALLPEERMDDALAALEPCLNPCSVPIGNAYEGLHRAIFSYQEALELAGRDGAAPARFYGGAEPADGKGGEKRQKLMLRAIIESLERGTPEQLPELMAEVRRMYQDSLIPAKSFLVHALGEVARYFGLMEDDRAGLDEAPQALIQAETLRGLTHLFQAQLMRIYEYFSRIKNSPTASCVQQACRIAARSFGDPMFSMARVAEELGVSYSYLSTIFKQVMGQGFSQYVTALRMEKARQLLLENRLKVYEIAQQVGSVNVRYLTETFKKTYGISPSEYLSRMGREHARQDDAE